MKYIISKEEYVDHPKNVGVYMKYFFDSSDNDMLNNAEVKIDPGYEIADHNHENSTEFFYVVEGEGEFHIEGEMFKVKKGDAMKAPTGKIHSIKNKSNEPLYLFVTFSPATR